MSGVKFLRGEYFRKTAALYAFRGCQKSTLPVIGAITISFLTITKDKPLIVSMLYEHFFNHVRLLGFRTQLMTACLAAHGTI